MIFRLRLASRAQLAVARISNRSSPEKMKINLDYLKNVSLRNDIHTLWMTVKRVLG